MDGMARAQSATYAWREGTATIFRMESESGTTEWSRVMAQLSDKSIRDAARNAELRELHYLVAKTGTKSGYALETTVFSLWPSRVCHNTLVAVVGSVSKAAEEALINAVSSDASAAAAASSSLGTYAAMRTRPGTALPVYMVQLGGERELECTLCAWPRRLVATTRCCATARCV